MKMAIGSGKLIYDRKLLERAWDQAVLWLILAAFCVAAYGLVSVQATVVETGRSERGAVSRGMISAGTAESLAGIREGKPDWMTRTLPGALVLTEEMDVTLKERQEAVKAEGLSDSGGAMAAAVPVETAPVEKAPAEEAPAVETPGTDTVAVPAEIPVILHGNGGLPETSELTVAADGFDLEGLAEPTRLGKLFDGWYLDAGCTIPFTKVEEGATRMDLYAGWKEFPGYRCDDAGYVTGYTDVGRVLTDGLVALPTHDSCVGLRTGAFAGIEEEIFDVYIPANITKIEEHAFDGMSNLMFIEVAAGNPAYYSVDGVLYHSDGSLAVMPAGRLMM